MNGLIGKKVGMTSVFDEAGKNVSCTLVEMGPCVVTQVKTEETDGYNSLQIGFGDAKPKNTPKAMMGHFDKAGTTPKSKLIEFRNFDVVEKKLGDIIKVDEVFAEGDTISAIGTSKEKVSKGLSNVTTLKGSVTQLTDNTTDNVLLVQSVQLLTLQKYSKECAWVAVLVATE